MSYCCPTCGVNTSDGPNTHAERCVQPARVVFPGYFGCTCGGRVDRPHCHTGGDCPRETPSTSERRHCVYGGIGCNVDHDAIARQSTDANAKADHLLRSVDFR